MSAVLPIPFALGEQLWAVGYGTRQEEIICPECAGTCVIEMIKGNGERVSLDCGYCSSGYDQATGKVKVYRYDHAPKLFVPRRVDVRGGKFSYSEDSPDANCWSSHDAKDLFRSRDDCQKRCDEVNAERVADDERRAIANISSKRRSLAFSASYWRHQVDKLRKDLERAEARLARCKKKPE